MALPPFCFSLENYDYYYYIYWLALILDNVHVLMSRGVACCAWHFMEEKCSPDLPVYYYATSDNLLNLFLIQFVSLFVDASKSFFIARNGICLAKENFWAKNNWRKFHCWRFLNLSFYAIKKIFLPSLKSLLCGSIFHFSYRLSGLLSSFPETRDELEKLRRQTF